MSNLPGKQIKAIRLALLLTPQEAAAFSAALSAQKRKSLKLLFDFIRQHLRQPAISVREKEMMFRAAFTRKYSKKEDYLLRNELRLLASELTEFLSVEQARISIKHDNSLSQLYFLRQLLERKEYELFESEYPKAMQEALRESDFEAASKMTRLLIDDFIYRKEATKANYERLLSLSADYYGYVIRAFLHDYIYVRHKQAFAERTLYSLLRSYYFTPLQPIMLSWDEKLADPYLEYMRLLAISYSLHGAEKIKTLSAAQQLIRKISKKGFDKNAALATTSAGIGLEYFLLGNYKESLPYHRKCLENASPLPPERMIAFVFNYLSALVRLENYVEAVRIIEKYRSTWETLPRMRDRFLCLKAMGHLFLNEPEAAWRCIPLDRKQSGIDHYYYYRFIQIIVFYLRSETALAMNEAENFEHTVRYQDKDENYLRLILLMKKFLRLQDDRTILKQKEYHDRRIKLKQEIDLEETEKRLPDKVLLYRWIARQLQ